MIADENHRITEFEEKPEHPRSNLASMGIYIFNWKTLKEALIAMADQPALDLVSMSFLTAMKRGLRCMRMSSPVIGRM